ncbi:glycosyltransferase [Streptacidiphilus sp. ASG 303]|uniref:glycosyltransferase family 2 protein n=1 Tax=Streptacidiphilus sp. ASG 303 TaxID=2896847 RepID=UPI001E4F604D|nr:glycosyltransferase family 2 protein [Streptacidiphilus sp. ASG 303]MCD0482068.1 glycosyltransferase [Streptacidiphilus sp. ASG 303]
MRTRTRALQERIHVKLSVIVPFYNVQAYAPDTLRSLAANTRPDFEFVLVDDCSTDGTLAVLEQYARTLPGAVVVRPEHNRGLAGARNVGLEAARGEYLTFLDGDDWISAGYLERLVGAVERHGCDFVRVDHVQVTGVKRQVQKAPQARRDEVLDPRDGILPADRATMVDYPYAWAGVYHRRLLERGALHFDEGLRTAEDRPWIWRLHRLADSYAVTGLRGVHYRRAVATSLTQVGDERQLDFIRAFDLVLEQLADDPDAELLLPKAVRTYCAVLVHHRRNADRLERDVARRLRTLSAEALRRMPQHHLADALDAMDAERAAVIRRLRGSLTAVGAR